jgi:hypothetical protein
MREIAFNKSNIPELNKFILDNLGNQMSEEDRQEIIKGVKEVEEHAPSVFLDTFDSVLKGVVRDKSIKSLEALNNKITSKLIPTLKAYVTWSWFNQNTNDLIEEIFKINQKIIPTLRRVHGVDFFVKINGKEMPVDLKLTFLPKGFFSSYSKKGKTTDEIIEMVKSNPKTLADWLYENQNPRLFNNNMRLFIVLIDKEKLEDSWKLKADYELIKTKVNSFLESLHEKEIIEVEYKYDKEDRVAGKYNTKCLLLIIEK